ncbi:SpoIIE family protein phosphatase [Actinoplanes sp. M2I2]|uniref:SpoIIE family protein phosphatase n=1 Tax=Actinoplanes sp. M2I2 TaxID=1734444 RepID=UPI0020201289|nr:SpoIIE family protein phosphatase [Actinoplanes sp. M2I2]
MTDSSPPNTPGRLDALRRTGLTAAADPTFDRFAAMVCNVLGVPVALVSLVEQHRQIFPGARGLADPWDRQRQTPLSHSFCQHLALTAEPLVITDARQDPQLSDNLAIEDLGVVGYAGMPLTDADGTVLGSLCAIDTEPHAWTTRELGLLADLAAACSDSLRLRIATSHAELGEQAARADEQRAAAAFSRSQMLLRATTVLATTSSVGDVVDAVRHLVTNTLDPAYVGVSLLDGPRTVALSSGDALPPEVAGRWNRYPRSATTPSALAISSGATVLLPDFAAVARLAPDAAATFTDLGWQSAASVPLPGPLSPIGALTFAWKQPNPLDAAEQTVLAALGGYVAQALQRAEVLDDRRTAAAIMQKALLTELPRHARIRMAARYLAATHADHVGGDWYDALHLDDTRLALVIGDVTGHNIHAAVAMSQLRSLLRALLVDRQESPSAVLRRLEHIIRAVGSTSLASTVLAYVDSTPAGTHTLTWANAGHPPPLLRLPDGTVELLGGSGPLIGAVRNASRRTRTVDLPPGSTLLLYTDGLIEARDTTIDDGIAAVGELLAATGDHDPDRLADILLRPGAAYEDDVAVLVVRIPGTDHPDRSSSVTS